MEKTNKYVVFSLDDQKFALPLASVERVVQVVEISPLAKAPDYIMGIINFHGEIVPVVNVRLLFNLSKKEINLSDKLIIAKTAMRSVALLVDSMGDMIEKADKEIAKSEKILLETRHVKGILRLNSGVVLLHDLDKLLTNDEVKLLKEALSKQKRRDK